MIFVDTGALLARFLPSDQHHEAAASQWSELIAAGAPLATSNLVIAEFLTLLARRASPEFAAERGKRLYESESLTILRPSKPEEARAVLLLERHAALRVSFVDCVSFVLIQRHAIDAAFSFDDHFSLSGVDVIPPK